MKTTWIATAIVAALSQWPMAAETEPLSLREPTVVRVTDKVLLKDVMRIGMNTGWESSPWDIPMWKLTAEENFEGGVKRQCCIFTGKSGPDGWEITGFKSDTASDAKGLTYTVISGAAKWRSGPVLALKPAGAGPGKSGATVALRAEALTGIKKGDGVMLETSHPEEGYLHRWYASGGWASRSLRIASGDVHPGAFGCCALLMPGTSEPAFIQFPTFTSKPGAADVNGPWRVRFWAKAKSGNPSLTVSVTGLPETRPVKLTAQWARHDELITIAGEKKAGPLPTIRVEVRGGDALLDDVQIWPDGHGNETGPANEPVGFRNDALATWKRLHPGVIRCLQGAGETVLDTINPGLRSRRRGGGLHQLYQLCEAVGAEPYICLPATMTREEMKGFMEYLGAPPTIGWGKLRAELGHPKPWTETFSGINIEFGNELYNFGGYGGPDYWYDLIEAGKKSPYYTPKVFFTMGVQGQALDYAQNTDSLSVANYVCWGFTKQQYEQYLADDDALFRWAFAWTLNAAVGDKSKFRSFYDRAQSLNIKLSMYEGSYHSNFGDGPNAPRNKLVTSQAGAVNYLNSLLLLMREYQMRKQCYFSFIQFAHAGGGNAFGSKEAGTVRIWGQVLSMLPGHERYRPGFLAAQMLNRVLSGDMVETVHTGAKPVFAATGPFSTAIQGFAKDTVTTLKDQPVIWSYALRDGKRRAVVLVNLDTRQARSVRLEFAGLVKGAARQVQLAADSLTANNELDWNPAKPAVELCESVLANFRTGQSLTLPPHSMTTLQWETP